MDSRPLAIGPTMKCEENEKHGTDFMAQHRTMTVYMIIGHIDIMCRWVAEKLPSVSHGSHGTWIEKWGNYVVSTENGHGCQEQVCSSIACTKSLPHTWEKCGITVSGNRLIGVECVRNKCLLHLDSGVNHSRLVRNCVAGGSSVWLMSIRELACKRENEVNYV